MYVGLGTCCCWPFDDRLVSPRGRPLRSPIRTSPDPPCRMVSKPNAIQTFEELKNLRCNRGDPLPWSPAYAYSGEKRATPGYTSLGAKGQPWESFLYSIEPKVSKGFETFDNSTRISMLLLDAFLQHYVQDIFQKLILPRR